MAVSATRKTAVKTPVVAESEVKVPDTRNKTASLDMEKLLEEFKAEYRGMPYTELSVIVQCGHRNAPTYQEIELPSVTEFLLNHRQ